MKSSSQAGDGGAPALGGFVSDCFEQPANATAAASVTAKRIEPGADLPQRLGGTGGSPVSPGQWPIVGMWPFLSAPLLEQRMLFVSSLPEGDLKIAHPFKGGVDEQEHRVPKGRLNSFHKMGIGTDASHSMN